MAAVARTDLLKTFIPWPVIAVARWAEVQVYNLRVARWERTMSEEPRLMRPIFMIGCPRSGTTLCARLFSSHPEIANWTEAGWIWDPVRYYDPQAPHHWTADRVTEKNVRRLHTSFEYRRQAIGKPRFFNKHPRNSVRIDYIRTIFPDALFIHVIRDGRAVVHSILKKVEHEPRRKKVPFGHFCKPPNWRQFLRDDPVEQAALQWREIIRYVLNKREALDGRYCQLKYEDLCARPRTTLHELYDFASLSHAKEHMSQIPEQLESRNFKYKEAFSEEQLRTVTRVQGKLLQELGYERTEALRAD